MSESIVVCTAVYNRDWPAYKRGIGCKQTSCYGHVPYQPWSCVRLARCLSYVCKGLMAAAVIQPNCFVLCCHSFEVPAQQPGAEYTYELAARTQHAGMLCLWLLCGVLMPSVVTQHGAAIVKMLVR